MTPFFQFITRKDSRYAYYGASTNDQDNIISITYKSTAGGKLLFEVAIFKGNEEVGKTLQFQLELWLYLPKIKVTRSFSSHTGNKLGR